MRVVFIGYPNALSRPSLPVVDVYIAIIVLADVKIMKTNRMAIHFAAVQYVQDKSVVQLCSQCV
jgi:hypothetical protein